MMFDSQEAKISLNKMENVTELLLSCILFFFFWNSINPNLSPNFATYNAVWFWKGYFTSLGFLLHSMQKQGQEVEGGRNST